MGIQVYHQPASFRHLAAKEEQAIGLQGYQLQPGPVDSTDFAAMFWKLQGQEVIIGVGYFIDGLCVAGHNLRKLKQFGSFFSAQQNLWMLFADCNMEPEKLTASLNQVGWQL